MISEWVPWSVCVRARAASPGARTTTSQDGTDATYCGESRAWHDHHPRCYQNTGVPDDLPDDLCDCQVLRMIDATTRVDYRDRSSDVDA